MIYQQPLPEPYNKLSPDELVARVNSVRKQLGKRLVILAHHYQRPEIVALGDYRGDSLKLAQFAASQSEAEFIVFCGVHFMAESADVLKTGQQTVILPDLGAGCDMADMADEGDVQDAWDDMAETLGHEDVMPITYINSTAALKAFVGKKGGVVCTSSNAEKIIRWGFSQRKKIFFFPDQHLGRNTCKRMGIPLTDMKMWEPKTIRGGLSAEDVRDAKVYLWKGHCPVHAMFTVKQIESLLAKDPSFHIISHPECAMEVVDRSSHVGSTEYIVKTIAEAPAGSKWAVGTELNLVTRIAAENPDKTVVSINPFMCLCGTMNRIDLPHLAWSLEQIIAGKPANVIAVKEPTRALALQTLKRMLMLS